MANTSLIWRGGRCGGLAVVVGVYSIIIKGLFLPVLSYLLYLVFTITGVEVESSKT